MESPTLINKIQEVIGTEPTQGEDFISIQDAERATRSEIGQRPMRISRNIPVGEDMTADLESIFESEQRGESIFEPMLEDYRARMFSPSASKRLQSIHSLASTGVLDTTNEMLDSLTDANKRSEIATQEAADFIGRVTDSLATGVIDSDTANMAINAYRDRSEEMDEYLSEIRAGRRLSEFAERNPSWSEFKLNNRDLHDKRVEDVQKDAIIRSFLDREAVMNNSTSWWEDLGEFYDDSKELIASIFLDEPITYLANYLGTSKAEKLRIKATEIRNLPVEEIPAALEEFKKYALDASSVYVEDNEEATDDMVAAFGSEGDRLQNQALMGMDAVLTVLTLGTVGGSGSMKSMMKKTGNVDEVGKDAAKVISDDSVEGSLYESAEEAVEESMPIKPTDPDKPFLHHSVQEEFDKLDQILEEAKHLASPGRLTEAEQDKAVDKTIRNLRLNNDVVNYGIEYDTGTGVYNALVMIGKVDGTGYASRKSAQTARNKIGLKGELVETQMGWKVKAKIPVKEANSDEGFQQFFTSHPVKAFLQGPKAFVDKFIGKSGTASAFKEARITGVLKDAYNKNISKLKSQEKENLSQMLERSYADEKWFTPEELAAQYRNATGEEIPDSVQQAYGTVVRVSDFTWFIQNRALYQDKVSKGLSSVRVKELLEEPFNGIVYSEADQIRSHLPQHLVYVKERGEVLEATSKVVDEIVDNQYVLIKPEDATWTDKKFGTPASYIAVKRADLKVSQLDWDQLGYVQGGRREYTSPFFIGQKNHMKGANGTRYLGKPKVMRTADTIAEASRFADNMNKAFEVLKDFVKARDKKIEKGEDFAELMAKASDDLEDLTGHSYSSFIRMIDDEGWDIDAKVEFKRDREDFPEDFEAKEAVKLYDPNSISYRFGTRKGNRLSARGEALKHVDESDSVILDPLSALRSSADQAIKFGAYSEFKISAMNRFATTFGKYIEGYENMSPYEMVVRGEPSATLAKSTDPKMREIHRAFKQHQFYIKSILRVRTTWDEMVQNTLNSLAQRIENKGKVGKKIAVSLYKAGNPIEKIRSVNYDLNLGMFNPAQFIMQAQSMFTGMAMSPAYGMAAFKEAFPLRYALIIQDEATTAYISKAMRELGSDLDAYSDIQKSAAQIKRIGMNDFGSNIAMMDAQSNLGMSTNPYMDKVARTREMGRVFFQEGERVGRLIAYGIAKRKYASMYPKKNVYGQEADTWIREETDRLLLSPNSDNNQMFTKGVLSLPTQFWSYMGKMADVFMTGANGRYTKAERAQLAGAQILLYGAGGMPFLDYIMGEAEKAGVDMDPDTAKFIHNGILDGMIYVASGGEMSTDLSNSAGFGGFFDMMYQNLSENTLGHVMFGATGGNISSAFTRMQATARLNGLWSNPDPLKVTEVGLAGVSSAVKSLSKASQAYIAYNTGVWYDKYGRKMFNVSKSEAIGHLFGLNPQNLSDVYDILSNKTSARDKYINEVTTTLQGLHNKYYRAETDEEREAIAQTIEALSVTSMQTGYWGDVSRRFLSFQRDANFLDSLKKQIVEDSIAEKAGTRTGYFTLEQREEFRKEQ